jgi:hypothetical protein
MRLRQLGLYAQELESGPFTFLLSHSVPVAYRDSRPDAIPPGMFRTERFFSKATTAHINKWVGKNPRVATVPHDLIVTAFDALSRWSDVPRTKAETLSDVTP